MKSNPYGPIDIVLVTWNRPKLTFMTLDAIRQNTKRNNYRLIVIDNNSSSDMMMDLLEYQSKGWIDDLTFNSENRGLEPARNQGLEKVKSMPYFVCVDNDCLPQKKKGIYDWVDYLVDLMERYPEYGAITCRMQVMIGTGNIFDGHEKDEIVEFPHPGGAYRIMQTELVKTVGGWRDDNPSRGQEERYIGAKIHEMGYKTGYAVSVRTLHLFGDDSTDRWGYDKSWDPEKSGHSDVYHPILERGDDPDEVKEYI